MLVLVSTWLCICSHYKVFGVPVQQTEDGTATKPLTLKVDANSLVSTAVSADLATEGTEAVPFLIGTYTTLPDDLAIDGHRTGYAFKPLTHYAAVVAAFTKAQVYYSVWIKYYVCNL